jgi:hypothetical protein
VEQNLDTAVNQAEIENYYNQNIKNFQLKDNIVKVFYGRFPADFEKLGTFKRFFHSDVPEFRDSVDLYFERYSDLYFTNDETWILFDDVLKFIPINTYNQEAYLQNHRKIEIREEEYVWYVSFTDFMIKDGVSPLSFEKDNIRQILLNKRKLNIINGMREEVLQKAIENNDFELFW